MNFCLESIESECRRDGGAPSLDVDVNLKYLCVVILLVLAIALQAQSAIRLKFDTAIIDLAPSRNAPGSYNAIQMILTKDLVGDQNREIIAVLRSGGNLEFRIFSLNEKDSRNRYQQIARLVSEYSGRKLPSAFVTFTRLQKNTKRVLTVSDATGTWYYPVVVNGKISTERKILIDTNFPGQESNKIQYLEYALDIDGDGVDELLIPDLERPRLWKGSGEDWQQIELPGLVPTGYSAFQTQGVAEDDFPPGWIYFTNFNYSGRFYFKDHNGDGQLDLYRSDPWPSLNLRDLGSQDREQLEVNFYIHHFADGKFAAKPSVTVQSYHRFRVDQMFCDFNNDGLPDKVETWSSRNLISPLSWMRIYLADGDTTAVVPQKHSFVFRSKDPIGLHAFADINRDGKTDLFQLRFDYAVTSGDDMASIFLSNELSFWIEGFVSSKDGWPKRPQISKKTLSRGHDYQRSILPKIILDHDFNSDGKGDLAINEDAGKLSIYIYDDIKQQIHSKRSAKLPLPPGDGFQLVDLNSDERADVIAIDPLKSRLIIHLSK